ncbi:hypothetical protein BDP27DRAFT_1417275 [Rhodocollybia butyracea]|uniref:Uncharacterized protein n=1 Tax=Rhodocollybia butyracea TaxID=206335 RepID=A0A9P5Q2C9_9AGAR|nr:hypothetical protein BDP27DRAFT_1417275 [Rhodocollybia butyracea]
MLYLDKPGSGVVITGQPGIGKSVFLAYLLAVLLSIPDGGIPVSGETPDQGLHLESAPVLFYTPLEQVLFYNSKCYVPNYSSTFQMNTLPIPHDDVTTPVWVLIDMGLKKEEPPLNAHGLSTIFPVQSASADPIWYQRWTDARIPNARYFGLPLWDEALLNRGLEFNLENSKFQARVTAWLEEGKTELPQVHCDTLDRFVWEGKLVRNDKEKAIKLLVSDAIRRVGYSAHDVYDFLFIRRVSYSARNAYDLLLSPGSLGMDMSMWREAVSFIQRLSNPGKALSNALVSIKPVKPEKLLSSDSFMVIWRTPEIHSIAEQHGAMLNEEQRAELFAYFRRYPESSTVVGHIYEPFVHEVISSNDKPLLSLQPMLPVTKSGIHTHATSPWALSEYPKITTIERRLVKYETLPLADLDLNCYYTPNHMKNPFFDSFFFCEESSAINAVFARTSTRLSHEDKPETGYPSIRNIVRHAREKFGKPVKIVYIYVGPEFLPSETRSWEIAAAGFPEGSVYYLGLQLPYKVEQVAQAQATLDSRKAEAEKAEAERNPPIGSASVAPEMDVESVAEELDVERLAQQTTDEALRIILSKVPEGYITSSYDEMEAHLRDYFVGFFLRHCAGAKKKRKNTPDESSSASHPHKKSRTNAFDESSDA